MSKINTVSVFAETKSVPKGPNELPKVPVASMESGQESGGTILMRRTCYLPYLCKTALENLNIAWSEGNLQCG